MYLGILNNKLKGPCVVHNCDTYCRFDLDGALTYMKDGHIPVFISNKEPIYSYVEADISSSQIVRTAEKKAISNLASIGTYIFKDSSMILDNFLEYRQEQKDVINTSELYIAPFYNYLIQKGFSFSYSYVEKYSYLVHRKN